MIGRDFRGTFVSRRLGLLLYLSYPGPHQCLSEYLSLSLSLKHTHTHTHTTHKQFSSVMIPEGQEKDSGNCLMVVFHQHVHHFEFEYTSLQLAKYV